MTIVHTVLGKGGADVPSTGPQETIAFLTDTSTDATTVMESGHHHHHWAQSSKTRRWLLPVTVLFVALTAISVLAVVIDVERRFEIDQLRLEVDRLKTEFSLWKGRVSADSALLSELRVFEEAVYREGDMLADDDDDDDENYGGEKEYGIEDDQEYEGEALKEDGEYLADEDDEAEEEEEDDSGNGGLRKKRQVDLSAKTNEGVPVISDSYGVPLNRSSSEGLRLYESLLSSGGRGEPRDPSVSWEATEDPIKIHHKTSPLWSSKPRKDKKYSTKSGPTFNDDELVYPRPSKSSHHHHRKHQRSGQLRSFTSTPTPQIMERRSRVKQTGTTARTIVSTRSGPPTVPVWSAETTGQHHDHTGHIKVLQNDEHRLERIRGRGQGKKRKNHNMRSGLEAEFPLRETNSRILAAHFNANTSHYQVGHEHYEGNGHLRHPRGEFKDWTPSSWVEHMGLTNYFKLQPDGSVVVKDSGVYLVYAQIFYLDEHDQNGFHMVKNGEKANPILQCTTTSYGEGKGRKANTCYSGAVVYLSEGDKVSLLDSSGLRYSVFLPGRSFFGLVKLTDAKLKK